MMIFASCGKKEKKIVQIDPNPQPQGLSPELQAEWDNQIKSWVEQSCRQCHQTAAFMANAEAFKKSASVLARIENGSMPPPASTQSGIFAPWKGQVLGWLKK